MTQEISNFGDHAKVTMQSRVDDVAGTSMAGYYHVVCRDKDGNIKWEEKFPNLVVAVGKQLMLDTLLRGSTYSVIGPYLGLISNSFTASASDTMASHTWTEFTNYSGGVRPSITFGSPTSADPSVITSSAVSYSISGAGGTVAGAFVCSVTSGTSGILFSVANFESPGDRIVVSGDTLNVTYTFSLDAA